MTFLIIKPCDIYLWIQSYTYPDEPGPASNENTAFSINHSVYLWTVWIHQVSSINVYHTNIFFPILKLSPSLTAIENFLSKHTKKNTFGWRPSKKHCSLLSNGFEDSENNFKIFPPWGSLRYYLFPILDFWLIKKMYRSGPSNEYSCITCFRSSLQLLWKKQLFVFP